MRAIHTAGTLGTSPCPSLPSIAYVPNDGSAFQCSRRCGVDGEERFEGRGGKFALREEYRWGSTRCITGIQSVR